MSLRRKDVKVLTVKNPWADWIINGLNGWNFDAGLICSCGDCETAGACSAKTLPEQEQLESCRRVFLGSE
jgi:hypothetical protein